MSNKSLKKNETALRVLEVLKMLIDGPVSSQEIINNVCLLKNIESIYAKETLLKYFATMELLGLKVEKDRKSDKYYLNKLPIEINLSEKEVKLLCLVKEYVNNFSNEYQKADFNSLITNLHKSFSQETKERYSQTGITQEIANISKKIGKTSILSKFQTYCTDAQKLKISYLNQSIEATEIFILEPKAILYESGNAYLYAYNAKLSQNQKLLIKNIINVKQLPQKVGRVELSNTIVFELKAPLAKSYKLKEGERVIDSSFDKLIVSNSKEDPNMLYRRLLKYGENCKILQPRIAKEEFKNYISNMLSNLEKGKH